MRSGRWMLFFAFSISLFLVFSSPLSADRKDMGGWEQGSEYNEHYNPYDLEKFRATVVDILKVTPMPGMSPATALKLKESPGDEAILVHLCPVWFAAPNDIGIKKGDRIKIRGAWAEIGEDFVFMASKIKKGDYFQFKVRLTKDGTPFWTMSEEQLAKERASD